MAVMLVQAEAAVMAGWQALQQQADSTVLTMPEHECNNHIPLYVAGTTYLPHVDLQNCAEAAMMVEMLAEGAGR